MTQAGQWSAALTAGIGRRVAQLRAERKITAERLAELVTEAGAPISRSVLANLENGRRSAVTVQELLAFASVLGVPPIVLLFPVGQELQVEVVPDRRMDIMAAVNWFMGQPHWPAGDSAPAGWLAAIRPLIRLFRHDRAVSLVTLALGGGPSDSLLDNLADLNQVRGEMLAAGEPLPEVPELPEWYPVVTADSPPGAERIVVRGVGEES
jgi:transcriptional regulator with XRE-family HTH domain